MKRGCSASTQVGSQWSSASDISSCHQQSIWLFHGMRTLILSKSSSSSSGHEGAITSDVNSGCSTGPGLTHGLEHGVVEMVEWAEISLRGLDGLEEEEEEDRFCSSDSTPESLAAVWGENPTEEQESQIKEVSSLVSMVSGFDWSKERQWPFEVTVVVVVSKSTTKLSDETTFDCWQKMESSVMVLVATGGAWEMLPLLNKGCWSWTSGLDVKDRLLSLLLVWLIWICWWWWCCWRWWVRCSSLVPLICWFVEDPSHTEERTGQEETTPFECSTLIPEPATFSSLCV